LAKKYAHNWRIERYIAAERHTKKKEKNLIHNIQLAKTSPKVEQKQPTLHPAAASANHKFKFNLAFANVVHNKKAIDLVMCDGELARLFYLIFTNSIYAQNSIRL
jgi:hypothetical protein